MSKRLILHPITVVFLVKEPRALINLIIVIAWGMKLLMPKSIWLKLYMLI